MSALRVVTEADFDDVVLCSPVPVLVEFFTEWCAPCKAVAPTLEDLSEEYGDKARIVSVDAEKSPGLAERYRVTGYPTMVLVKHGVEVCRPQVRTRLQLRDVIDDARGVAAQAQVPSTLPPEDATLAPDVAALVARLSALDADAWKQVETKAGRLTQQPAPSSAETAEAVEHDEAALTAATTRLLNDVEELAAAKVGDRERAQAIASAAAASFERWVRRSPFAPGWMGALRAVPAARMSPYLPSGEAAADISVAATDCLEKLRGLSDDEWVQIRAVNRDVWPYAEHKDHGVNAFLCAFLVVHSLISADLLPDAVRDACWEPFEGVLDREGIAA